MEKISNTQDKIADTLAAKNRFHEMKSLSTIINALKDRIFANCIPTIIWYLCTRVVAIETIIIYEIKNRILFVDISA
jgi:hypothetical protein